jgi:glycosyltransferase involved in cell wall biosynthesis
MGSYMDYKNVECLVDAIIHLPDFKLHLLSRISEDRKHELLSRTKSPKQIIFHNGVSDQEYQEILSTAFALVSASRDEGFGIPVIEAMERGTPAVVSNIEIFREIGGEGALYFDSENPMSLVDRIRELEDDSTWALTSKASIQQASKFNWNSSAEALLAELKSL